MIEEYIKPFVATGDTLHNCFPFSDIKITYFEPAITEAIAQHKKEVNDIIDSKEKPTFENTILALEKSGELLDRVTTVFHNLLSANTCDELQSVAESMMPIISEHSNNISLNEQLFERVKYVYDNELENLEGEDRKLTEDTYKGFERSGANLCHEDREEYRRLTSELSLLSLKFGENNLKETNNYFLHIEDEKDIQGLPQTALSMAEEEANSRELNGWVFTLQAPSYIPFLMYADNRKLREQLYRAYNTKCTHDNEENNFENVRKIVNNKMRIAQLLGYENYADYVLKERMAEDSVHVHSLLSQLLDAYKPAALKEVEAIEEMARSIQGEDFKLMPWDWAYYSQKLKDQKYEINDEMLRPYFKLENVIDGVFGLASSLYGITFKKNKNIPTYHDDVEAFEVFDEDGSFLAVLYTDFFPRASKRSGAWMTNYKEEWIDLETGEYSRPHVSIVMNFTKPTKDKPALLTLGEVETFLHEFGHSLHSIFAKSKYKSLSGTNVYWDFVELPSQLMENFATDRNFLQTFAFHYETGELIPDELIDKIKSSANFNVAYACMRQVSFGLLDMAWYERKEDFEGDVEEYESKAWEKALLLPQIDGCCMSVQFSHIFAGGYSAGYYSYKWAEVLDADAFELFKKNGVISREIAKRFRQHILSKGGTEHPMELYKRFKGEEPSIDALLRRNGITAQV